MGELNSDLVHIVGHRELLSLDSRCRFRLPDEVARKLERETGRVAGHSDLPPTAFERLSFYFVPGTNDRLFLYPAPNIRVAIDRFENPPPGQDPALLRAARDYFYGMMCFVEADRQNRLQIPEHLREHAGIEGAEDHVVLVCHNLWLTVVKGSAAKQLDTTGREALEQVGPSVLDPVDTAQQPSTQDSGEQ
jgi:DNA-binding transcriptional regulator/RsmH inhibitor MraZ